METQEALAIREIHPGSEACPPKKKTKVTLGIFILVAVHAARSATNVVYFFGLRVPTWV